MPADHQPSADAPRAHDPADGARAARAERERAEATAIHALMTEAERLYKERRYRQARAVCQRLAEVEPSAVMPEQMIEACHRELRRRRALVLGLVVAVVVAAVAGRALYRRLARIRAEPAARIVRVAERGIYRFAFSSGLGRHRGLEYTWRLLDAHGAAVTASERRELTQEPNQPWACAYAPSHFVAKTTADGAPTLRTLVVGAVDDDGTDVLARSWTIEVANVPQAPVILSVHPPGPRTPGITTDGAARFHVEARDGDGAAAVTYQWLLDARPVPGATGPEWTYRPDPAAIAKLEPKRDEKGTVVRTVACRVANRFGPPFRRSHTWHLLVTPARAIEP